ncbi:hypothetical protein V3C99_003829 [Haemonchus contortus]
MLELLNQDIIYILCSFLDLASLASLAVVFPRWSDQILRSVTTKIWAIKLRILPQHCTIQYSFLDESKNDVLKCIFEEDEVKQILLEGTWEELPNTCWQSIPFHMMNIVLVDITQFGSSVPSDEVLSVLSSVSTTQLSLKFEARDEGRKLLNAISFDPGSTLYIHELTFITAKEPLLQQAKLANVKDLWFTGDMMKDDLLHVLNSDVPSMFLSCYTLRQSLVEIIKDYIKRFLDGNTSQKSCRISASGGLLRYLFEGIGGRGETRLSNGSRKVILYDGIEETPIHCFIDAIDDNK